MSLGTDVDREHVEKRRAAASVSRLPSGSSTRAPTSTSPGAAIIDGQLKTNAEAAVAKEMFKQMTPLGRLGRPEGMAEVVLLLATDDSSYSTRIDLVADGGVTQLGREKRACAHGQGSYRFRIEIRFEKETDMAQRSIPLPAGVVRYGSPDFFDAYGAAWGFKDTLIAFYASDGSYTDKASNITVHGHEGLRRFMKVYLRFSPHQVVQFTKTVKSERGFAAEWIWSGTNDGPLRLHGYDCPQDGSQFSIPGISVCTVNDAGEIQTHADYWDAAALLQTWKAIKVA